MKGMKAMDAPTKREVEAMLDPDKATRWESLTAAIDGLYGMDRLWDSGYGDWSWEYKYRRGGKTLCTFYAKPGDAIVQIILGKAEWEAFDAQRARFSEPLQTRYDDTRTYRDDKWLAIPLDETLSADDILTLLKIRRRPNRK